MREIKFRAKDHVGVWVYGDLRLTSREPHIWTDPYTSHIINTDTIGQYTGLKDKNGKEIYEGDIIGCNNPSIKHLIFYNEKQARFMAALNGDTDNDFTCVCGLDDSRWNASKEVIGNIFDDPELVEL